MSYIHTSTSINPNKRTRREGASLISALGAAVCNNNDSNNNDGNNNHTTHHNSKHNDIHDTNA